MNIMCFGFEISDILVDSLDCFTHLLVLCIKEPFPRDVLVGFVVGFKPFQYLVNFLFISFIFPGKGIVHFESFGPATYNRLGLPIGLCDSCH